MLIPGKGDTMKSRLAAFVTVLLNIAIIGCQPGGRAVLKPAIPPKPAKNIVLDLGNETTLTLVLIPRGTFLMGSPANEKGFHRGQGPQREVAITKPFYMGIYEVTQAQYEAVVGRNQSRVKGATNPVENVSKDDALLFCRKATEKTGLQIRLPTEAEWEYACRAGTQTRFSSGDDDNRLGDHAWYEDNSGVKSHPVGQKARNTWGLYDMHGNVFEWCSDHYDVYYYQKGDNVDPQGPADARQGLPQQEVLRGGSYCDSAQGCRAARRGAHPRYLRDRNIGFRVVADVK